MATADDTMVPSDVSDESDDGDQALEALPSPSKKVRSSRACVACRRMKTRCEIDEALGAACKLCIRTRRPCVMQSLPRRRKRKTTDRVADLEQKITALTALLAHKDIASAPGPDPRRVASAETPEHLKCAGSEPSVASPPTTTDSLLMNALQHRLLDWTLACQAFDRYKRQLSQYLPFVVFPAGTDANEVRDQQPLLFFAIITVSVLTIRPAAGLEMANALAKDLAMRIVYRGERSLELVQALLVHTMFFTRAKEMRELNFNQLIHIASTMALDIGLGRRSHASLAAQSPNLHQLESLAGRRAWLGCYYLASSVSTSLRHPAFVRWSVYIEECLDVLSKAEALPSDPWLCDLVRLQHVAEDACNVFSMDDPAAIVTLRDVKTQYQLGGFRQQLEHWRRYCKADLTTPFARHTEASAKIFIHEVALHAEHNIDELRSPLRPPHRYTDVDELASSMADLQFVPARVDALFTCHGAIHDCFDAILSMDLDTLCALPNLFFVRTGYAARALRKLLRVCERQAQTKGRFSIDIKDLKFEEYLDALIDLLGRVYAQNQSQLVRAFCMVLAQIKDQGVSENRAVDRQLHPAAALPPNTSVRSLAIPLPATMVTLAKNGVNQTVDANALPLPDPASGLVEPLASTTFPTPSNQAPLAANADLTSVHWAQPNTAVPFMSGADMLQWFEQDFAFDSLPMYGYEQQDYQTEDRWQQ